jgi:glycosyltransferase involved in cell wall biosynthesis
MFSERAVRLTIVLPNYSHTPSGGYRVHYEYANRLAARGHAVTVVAPVWSRRRRLGLRRRGLRRSLRRIVAWFTFDPRVRLTICDGRSIPRCDVAIVTAWQTAEMVATIRRRARGVVQVAYDYEFWMTADDATRERMARAFADPDIVVTTSHAVTTMLREADREPDVTITCGIDLDVFHVVKDPASREAVVGFIARPGPIKRCEDAVAALARIRTTHKVRVVAVGPGRINLPSWVETLDAPTNDAMCSFYNDLAIYLLPSAYEGWGLTAVEAMACGAAVITTRNGGVEDFARDGVNALLVPPCEPDSLGEACARLLDDEATRIRIAESGVGTAHAMDWEPSVDAIEKILDRFR